MNFLGDIPIIISVNGVETPYDEDEQGYLTGTTDSDIIMFFSFGDEGEILQITNYDWDVYSIPKGIYEISLTIPANNMADGLEKVITFTITVGSDPVIVPCKPDIGTVSANNLSDTLDISNVVLNRTNEAVAGTLELTDSTLLYGTHDYNWKFTPQDTTNYEILTGIVSITVVDTKMPTATYQIGTGGEKEFLNNTDIKLFYTDYQKVEINYSDEGSGISAKQYYISGTVVEDTSSIEWNDYTEQIDLGHEGIYIIYVKITDNYGNTMIFSSECIIIYTDSIPEYVQLGHPYHISQDLSMNITTNGNTIAKLTDENGNEIDRDAYTMDSNGTLTLNAPYLASLDKGSYTYIIHMNPQGVETSEVTLNYQFTLIVKKHVSEHIFR